jgi:hypothetical protein
MMESLMTTINGSEDLNNLENEKMNVLIRFYKAFNQRDLKLMKNVWLNSDEASMNNPVGGILRGWENIKMVYDKIFNGKAKVYVEFYDFTVHSTGTMFIVTGRERGFFEKENIKIDLAIRTSRVFIKENEDWKHIQHHGSIDNPDLLKKYQDAILTN